MVVAQANDPARSIADVAHEHGLNANMIARWRRGRERNQSATHEQPTETFIPVQLPVPAQVTSRLIVECGAVRVRLIWWIPNRLSRTALTSWLRLNPEWVE